MTWILVPESVNNLWSLGTLRVRFHGIHSWKNSVEACVVTTISRFAGAKYVLHPEDFRKLNIFERKGWGEGSWISSKLWIEGIDCFSCRFRDFQLSSTIFLRFYFRDVMTPPSRLKEGLITWIGIFPSSWSWLTYFIQSHFMRLSQNFNLIL